MRLEHDESVQRDSFAENLEIVELSLEYRHGDGWLRALDRVSFTVAPQEVFGLAGESGCWPALTGQDSHLLGRIEGFRHVYPSTWPPLSPSFAWRNNRSRMRARAGRRPRGVMYAGHMVETAPAAELFGHPRHPYSRGLIATVKYE